MKRINRKELQNKWDEAFAKLGGPRKQGLPTPEEDGLCMYASTPEVLMLMGTLLRVSQSPDTAFIVQFLDSTLHATIKALPGSKWDRDVINATPNPMGGWDIG